MLHEFHLSNNILDYVTQLSSAPGKINIHDKQHQH